MSHGNLSFYLVTIEIPGNVLCAIISEIRRKYADGSLIVLKRMINLAEMIQSSGRIGICFSKFVYYEKAAIRRPISTIEIETSRLLVSCLISATIFLELHKYY